MPDSYRLPPLPDAWIGADGTHRVDTVGDAPVPERLGARAAAWRHLLDLDLHDVLVNARLAARVEHPALAPARSAPGLPPCRIRHGC